MPVQVAIYNEENVQPLKLFWKIKMCYILTDESDVFIKQNWMPFWSILLLYMTLNNVQEA